LLRGQQAEVAECLKDGALALQGAGVEPGLLVGSHVLHRQAAQPLAVGDPRQTCSHLFAVFGQNVKIAQGQMLAELHILGNRIYYLRICTLFLGGVKIAQGELLAELRTWVTESII
jgi:hypothetical protein